MLADQYRDKLSYVDKQQIINIFFNDPEILSVTFYGLWLKLEFIDGSVLFFRRDEDNDK